MVCTAEGAESFSGNNYSAAPSAGFTLWSTQDAGVTWADDGETTGINLSCPSATSCVAVDYFGHVVVGGIGVLPISGSTYNPVTPYRISDTRAGSGEPNSGQSIGPLGTLNVQVSGTGTGSDGVPATGATAVALNLTAVAPTRAGYLTAWPVGLARPVASNLNFTSGQTVANMVVLPLGASGQVSIFNGLGSTNVVVDVVGWFGTATGGSSAGQYVTAQSPTRIDDTRIGSGFPSSGMTLAPHGTLTVTGFSEAPVSGSSALALNVTVTNAESPGYLTVYPTGNSRPVASNLNWSAGQTAAGRVISPTDSSDDVTIYNGSFGTVDVIVDETGWFTNSSGTGGGLFTAMTPARITDTRSASGYPNAGNSPAPDNGDVVVAVAGAGVLPNSVPEAAMVNVTATGAPAAGYMTVADANTWSMFAGPPMWSDLNWAGGQTVANSTLADVGTDGAIDVINGSAGPAAAVVDISGWFS